MHFMVKRRKEGHPREEKRMCTAPPDASKDQQLQDQRLMSTMIKWITSQSSLTREDADSVQVERRQSIAVNMVFVCASSQEKATEMLPTVPQKVNSQK